MEYFTVFQANMNLVRSVCAIITNNNVAIKEQETCWLNHLYNESQRAVEFAFDLSAESVKRILSERWFLSVLYVTFIL